MGRGRGNEANGGGGGGGGGTAAAAAAAAHPQPRARPAVLLGALVGHERERVLETRLVAQIEDDDACLTRRRKRLPGPGRHRPHAARDLARRSRPEHRELGRRHGARGVLQAALHLDAHAGVAFAPVARRQPVALGAGVRRLRGTNSERDEQRRLRRRRLELDVARVHEDGDEVGVVRVDVSAPEVAQTHLLGVARQVLGRQQHLDQRVHLLFEVGQHDARLVDVHGVLAVVRRARLLAGALVLGVQAALLASVRHCAGQLQARLCAQGRFVLRTGDRAGVESGGRPAQRRRADACGSDCGGW